MTSAATSTEDLESIVTKGEDMIFFISILLLFASLTHTFRTKSRSVTIPIGLLLFLIFLDASCAVLDDSIVFSLSVIRPPIEIAAIIIIKHLSVATYKDYINRIRNISLVEDLLLLKQLWSLTLYNKRVLRCPRYFCNIYHHFYFLSLCCC